MAEFSSLNTRDLHEQGAEMQVKDQFGQDTDFFITVAGIDSQAWESAAHSLQMQSLRPDGDKTAVFASMATITLGWRGLTDDGTPVEFSTAKALELYQKAPYICKQVERFFADRLNFLQPTQKK